MKKILINDLLRIPESEIYNTRLKLNVHDGNTDPLEEYKQDPDLINIQWFLWHKDRRYFHTGNIAICLLYLYDDKWLLTTVKRTTKELDVVKGMGYETEEMEEYSQYYGRFVLHYHKNHFDFPSPSQKIIRILFSLIGFIIRIPFPIKFFILLFYKCF